MDGQQHAAHVDRDVQRVEQPSLPSDDEPDSDVHRIAHEAVQTFDDEDSSRRDRCWSPAADQSKAPERGVEIDRHPDGDDGKRCPILQRQSPVSHPALIATAHSQRRSRARTQ